MSVTVFLIGALHAIPPIIAGAATNSRIVVILATAGTAYVAVTIGGGRYTPLDLFFVFVGAGVGWIAVSKSKAMDLPVSRPKPTGATEIHNEGSIEERRAKLVRGAESGNQDAQLFYSSLLIEGENIYSASRGPWNDLWFPRDICQGFFWLNSAIDQGRVSAHEFIPEFYEQTLLARRIDPVYLGYCINALQKIVDRENKVEDVETLTSLTAIQILGVENSEQNMELVKHLNDTYRKKYVK